MPLPVLHSFVGYSVYRASRKHEPKIDWKWGILFIVLANGPDFDYLPGILAHHADQFHRGASHSLGVAIVVGLGIGLCIIARRQSRRPGILPGNPGRDAPATRRALRPALWSAVAYFSHPLLDMLNGPKYGMPVFWPFNGARFSAPIQLIPAGPVTMHEARGLGDFVFALFHPAFVRQFFFECAILFSILSLYGFWAVVKKQARLSESFTLATSACACIFVWAFFAFRG